MARRPPTTRPLALLAALVALASCAPTRLDSARSSQPPHAPIDVPDAGPPLAPRLGAQLDVGLARVVFRVRSGAATRVEVALYGSAEGEGARLARPLEREGESDVWRAVVTLEELGEAGVAAPYLYGYRAWGPNWPFDDAWAPGSLAGFVADVDEGGHRFNPNKLLVDPHARELSHDPTGPLLPSYGVYATGPEHRGVDSAPWAPKGLVLDEIAPYAGVRPARPLHDDIVYEVHPRGFTRADPLVSPACRGTYAGAAEKADYLASIGVTAIELMPVHETDNDRNDHDVGAEGDNYWGYATLGFFAPDRRYACDKTAGGPTREFRAMVEALHARGIKVILDVVYNHTAEGGTWGGPGETATLLSFRGLDNAAYYELTGDGAGYVDHTGTGASTNATSGILRDLVIDSLRYWRDDMGVDGFRFDLASVLANACARDCFTFDPDDENGILMRAANEVAGAPLIAEPWGIGEGTYQQGSFPAGWSEWNSQFRDLVRRDQNRLGSEDVTMGWLSARLSGSSELFGDDGRPPSASVNYVVSHDGFTLRDLYRCNEKNNDQPWPHGPSDGGDDHNLSWDQGGDPALQRQAARTGLALLMLAAGVPMITGGDELYRTQACNNNPYNVDADENGVDWSNLATFAPFHAFAGRIMRFRAAHPALRPATYGAGGVTWHKADGAVADGAYMDDPAQQVLAYRVDGAPSGDSARSIYVAYNGGASDVTVHLPAPTAGFAWYRSADTGAWMEPEGNASEPGEEHMMAGTIYDLAARSLAVWIER